MMGKDRKLEGRLKVIEQEVDLALDDALGMAREANSHEAGAAAHVGRAIALELRALRLAVLSREPVRWWW
jgi:hypothetical protein